MRISDWSSDVCSSDLGPGIQVKGAKSNGGSQPPRNRIDVIALIRIMLAYSPRKNRAKVIAEYSTKKPATSSDSPSGRSKGERLVSASVETTKITNIGSRSTEHTSEPQSQMRSSYAVSCVKQTKPY